MHVLCIGRAFAQSEPAGGVSAIYLAERAAPDRMAIYHLSVKPISWGSGRSTTSAGAYRSASRIRDEATRQVFDYSPLKSIGAVTMNVKASNRGAIEYVNTPDTLFVGSQNDSPDPPDLVGLQHDN